MQKLLTASIAIGLCTLPLYANEHKVIAIPQSPSAMSVAIQQQIQTAYAALNLQVQFVDAPAKRRLLMLRNNEIDAELFRLCSMAEMFTDVIVIQQPLANLDLNAYFSNDSLKSNWRSNSKLRVAYVRGFYMAEQQLFAGTAVPVSEVEQAFALLQQQRVDVVLEDHESAADYLNRNPAHNVGLTFITVHQAPVCHVISERNAALAAPLLQQIQH